MDKPLYAVENVRLSYPDMSRKPLFGAPPRIEILKGVTVRINEGDIIGIVGGSGSGKSTFGRALLRLTPISHGAIYYCGRDIAHASEAQIRALRREIQMIFQDPLSSLNPRHTVSQIIAGPLRLHGFDSVPDRVRQALDDVGLGSKFANRYPHELSGGQRQRVGIARAIALEPRFILADEVTSGLDVSSQAMIVNLLRELVVRKGLTLAFVSHDLSVIRMLCTRVMVMQEGKIVDEGPVDTVFSSPAADYTRKLIEAIPLPDVEQAF